MAWRQGCLLSVALLRSIECCSFFLANFLLHEEKLHHANFFQQRRGPDGTSIRFVETTEGDVWSFLHNLLAITGEPTPQPIWEDEVVALFNGQIYNFRSLLSELQEQDTGASDAQVILPSYRRWGDRFAAHFDGEFAIAIVDFPRKTLLLATDPFSTKPLHFAFGSQGRFAASSYESALKRIGFPEDQISMADPNTLYKATFEELYSFGLALDRAPKTIWKSCDWDGRMCIPEGEEEKWFVWPLATWPFHLEYPLHKWNLTQSQRNMDGWIDAFFDAVLKRTRGLRKPAFLSLSAGYDSGAVHLALAELGAPHYLFSIRGVENRSTIAARLRQHRDKHAKHEYVQMGKSSMLEMQGWFRQYAETFVYGDRKLWNFEAKKDRAAQALGMVMQAARDGGTGLNVHLSPHGGDELFSMYQTEPPLKFPRDLRTIFPWPTFYLGSMRNFLMKEEMVAGAFGIETRYPLLDKKLVQAFLSLDHRIKSLRYKSPIHDLFVRFRYPFEEGVKTPFVLRL